MFQQIIVRTEQIMNRNKSVHDFKHLTKEDNDEAKSLMSALERCAERQNSYPQSFNQEYVTDDQIDKINKYHIWFECLN